MKRKLFLLIVFCITFLSFTVPVFAQEVSILRSSVVMSKGKIIDSRGFHYDGGDIKTLSDKMKLLYKSCQ